MAQQVVNTGTAPNDKTGDPLQVAFTKLNANDAELYAKGLTPGPTGATGPQGVAGAPGGVGTAGVTGPTGPIGLQGTAGTAGGAGAAGATGPTGLQGTAGTAGAAGPTGPVSTTPGPTGPTGGAGTGGGGGGFTSSSTAPVAPNPGDYWYDLSTGVLSVRINDGNSSQWVKVSPGGGGGNVYAAPFDAMAYNGMQINGSMEVAQENGTNVVVHAAGTVIQTVDDWKITLTGTAAATSQQVTDAPPGYTSSLKISVTTAVPTLTTGQRLHFLQPVEGYRLQRVQPGLATAQPFSIGFWTKIHRPGVYSVLVRDNGTTRSYAATYTQNAADTWEYKTITIPGDTVAWANPPLYGNWMYFAFPMAASPEMQIAPGVWTAGNAWGATGITNGIAATTDTFQITGIVLLPGIQLPTAAQSPFIMRPYDQELTVCKRYLWKRNFVANQYIATLQAWSATTASGALFQFPVELRGTPTMTTLANSHYSALTAGASPLGGTGLTLGATVDGVYASPLTVASGLVAGNATAMFANTATWMMFDARL